MINCIELFDELANNILFDELSLNENENIINIQMSFKDELKTVKKILAEFIDHDEYELINKNDYDIIIKFNDNIKYIDENEYIEKIKDEIEYYESLISKNDIKEILNEFEIDENEY